MVVYACRPGSVGAWDGLAGGEIPPKDAGLLGALKRVTRHTIIVCVVCTSFVGVAQAQIIPDAGTILREQEQKPLEVPTRPAPTIKHDEPARPALKPADTPHFVLKGFRVTGNTVFAERSEERRVGKECRYGWAVDD